VVLVLIGSDLSIMERLVVYGAPLYQRPTCELVVPPLSPLEVSRLSDRSAAAALDAYLVTGGFPKIARLWRGGDLGSFLTEALTDPRSDLVRTGSMILDAEFPSNANARSVLSVIGAGERTHSRISARTGVSTTNLTGLYGPLTLLSQKGIIEAKRPLSTATTTLRHYRIVDPYIRFWLRFIEPNLGEIERGLGPAIVPRLVEAFPGYRGHAIEPLVRQAIERLSIAGDRTFDGARAVGSFWTRDSELEVDLVGADRSDPPAGSIAFVGTIKWREHARVTGEDIGALTRAAAMIEGVDARTRMVAVSRSGFDRRIAAPVRKISSEEILQAFPAD
jgi:AAA+ ATPase superfamily predicted ATPase